MGDDERSAETGAATSATSSAAATSAFAAGRDQKSVRPTAGGLAVEGGDFEREEGTPASKDDSAGLGTWAKTGTTTVAGETDSASETAAEARQGLSLDTLKFHALRAIRYYDSRVRFLDRCRRWLDFLVIVGGAGATTSLFALDKGIGAAIGLLVAAVGALQLVFDFGKRAQEHAWLRKRYNELLARVVEAQTAQDETPATFSVVVKFWTGIWAEEPETMHALEAIAFNAAMQTLDPDLDEGKLIVMTGWQAFTANLSAQETFRPLTRAEREKACPEHLTRGNCLTRWFIRYA